MNGETLARLLSKDGKSAVTNISRAALSDLPALLCQYLAQSHWAACFTWQLRAHLITGTLEKSDIWTQSRQNLEDAIEEEKENTNHNWDSDLLSSEQRLEQRLDKLKLDMFIMGSDGACQVGLNLMVLILQDHSSLVHWLKLRLFTSQGHST